MVPTDGQPDAAAAGRPVGHDPGLASARTSLAWERTSLSLLACGIAVAKDVPVLRGGHGHPLVGIAILVLGAIVSLTSSRQARQRAKHFGTTRPAATLQDLAPLTLAIALVGIAGTVISAI